MTSRPRIHGSYHLTEGCHCCAEVFVKYEYEDRPRYYCVLDKEARPRCGSVLMEESFFCHRQKDLPPGGQMMDEWEAWSKDREVAAWGRCNYYIKGAPEGE